MIPELGRSPGEGNGYPLQYSGLENSMERGDWQAIDRGVAKSQTRLSDFHVCVYVYLCFFKVASISVASSLTVTCYAALNIPVNIHGEYFCRIHCHNQDGWINAESTL